MDEVGVADPDYEFKKWLEEREAILKMNQELNARTKGNGARESASPSRVKASRNKEVCLKTGVEHPFLSIEESLDGEGR